jgi:hypothetical protein
VSEKKFVVRDLTEGQGIRVVDRTTGSIRSLRVFEKFGNAAELFVGENGEHLYRKRVRVGLDLLEVWPDLSVKLYQRTRGDWRFAFQVPDNLKLDRI